MGYYIDFNGKLNVSDEVEAALRANAKVREEYDGDRANFPSGEESRPEFENATIDQILSALLPGEDDDTVTGGLVGGYSKYYDQEVNLTLLASLGVTGHVDATGEDSQMWRWRLRDGELLTFVGQCAFPDDDTVD